MADDIRANLDQPSVPEDEPTEDTEQDVEGEEGEATVEADNTEAEPEEDKAEDTTVEKDPPRVPYSRFETVNERAIRAEEQLRIMQEERERERLAQAAAPTPAGLPTYWVKLYGDSDASKEAYALRQQELAEERKTIQSNLREELQREQVEAEQRTEQTVEDWSNQIDDFAAQNKRKFSDAETDALLDVMDELTPKDENGNYIVEPIQYLPQAVELYDLRQEKALASKKASKQATARLTGARSEGSLVTNTKEWDGNWEKKLNRLGL